MQDPEAQLERALIGEFLQARGYDLRALDALPEDQRKHLLESASVYAAGKLAEIEARARFVHEVHTED
jgi:hypothetical protein